MINLFSLSPKTIARIARGAVELEQCFYCHCHGWSNRYCIRVTYPNGYSASIVCIEPNNGNKTDIWEVALLKDGELCCDDDGFDGIMAQNINEEEVVEQCDRIYFM